MDRLKKKNLDHGISLKTLKRTVQVKGYLEMKDHHTFVHLKTFKNLVNDL